MTALRQAALKTRAAQETITGTVIGVRFYNPKNGWAVLSVNYGGESVTVVGAVPNPREGDEYEFTGRTVTDPKYGKQFKAESFEVLLPSTKKGIIRYLSTLATGVGEVKASRIVGALGDDCLTRIATDAEALAVCNFLTSLQRQEIVSALAQNRALADLCGLVCREGITPAFAAKIMAYFGENAMDVVKSEPYRLIEIDGIGFSTADKVAMAVGIPEDHPQRIQAAILHILQEARDSDGHCSLRPNDLVKEVPALLGADVGVPKIAEAVAALIHAEMLVRDGDDIYLTELHEAECKVAESIRRLLSDPCEIPASLDSIVRSIEGEKEVAPIG